MPSPSLHDTATDLHNLFPQTSYRHRRSDFIDPRLLPAIAEQTVSVTTDAWGLNMPRFDYKILEKIGFKIPVDISYQMLHGFHTWFDAHGKPLAHIHVFGSYKVPFFDGPLDAGNILSRLKLYVFTPEAHTARQNHFKHQLRPITDPLPVIDNQAMIATGGLIAAYAAALDRHNPLYTVPGDVLKTILAANVIEGHPMAQRILDASPVTLGVLGAMVAFYLIRNNGGNSNTGCADVAELEGIHGRLMERVTPEQAPFIDRTLIPQMVAKKKLVLPEQRPMAFAA